MFGTLCFQNNTFTLQWIKTFLHPVIRITLLHYNVQMGLLASVASEYSFSKLLRIFSFSPSIWTLSVSGENEEESKDRWLTCFLTAGILRTSWKNRALRRAVSGWRPCVSKAWFRPPRWEVPSYLCEWVEIGNGQADPGAASNHLPWLHPGQPERRSFQSWTFCNISGFTLCPGSWQPGLLEQQGELLSNLFWKTYLSPNPNMQDVQLKAFYHLFPPWQLLDSLSNAGCHPCSAALGLILHGVVLGSLLEHRQKSEDRYSVLLRSRDCECDAPAFKANKPPPAMQLRFGCFTENFFDTFGLSKVL